ncbi:sodium-independent sulfate anion transporter-like [Anopheles cruzii]|uniref:sodium-independent sulfate anion transporter-like n=1 Tax=Anopheles cruzii TaxID=68878 RepID=UPI0022EC5D1C|nr:sodium-independent sulfate anion transporter-like [Anopheles cruzii]
MQRVSCLVVNQSDERIIANDYSEESPHLGQLIRRQAKHICSYSMLKRRFPVLSWLPSYQWSYLLYDIIAGITVGLTAIPQSIAYGILANLQPEYGIYSNVMGCVGYALFGSVKDVTIAPTSLTAILVQGIVAELHYGTALLTFLSALITIMFGVLNLGVLVRFISIPVVMGFTTAACLTIGSAQVRSLLGISSKGKGSDFVSSWSNVFTNLNQVRWADSVLGVSSILLLVLFRFTKDFNITRSRPFFKYARLLSNAVVVVIGTLLAYLLTSDIGNPAFLLTGPVKAGLPTFQAPPFSYTNENGTEYSFSDMIGVMRTTIITIPLVTTLEIVSVAKAFSMGRIINATQEMIALGVSNLLVCFCSPLPVAASFTRSAINNSSGVRTSLGCAITAIMLLLSLTFLTEAFYYIPKATLASIVINAMIFLVDYEEIGNIWRTKKIDMIPFLATAASCLFWELDYGILVGIGIHCAFLLYLISSPRLTSELCLVSDMRILLIGMDQSLAFSSAERLRDWILRQIENYETKIDLVVIDGQNVNFIDMSVAKNVVSIEQDLRARKIQLLLWRFETDTAFTLLRMRKELFLPLLRADHELEEAVAGWKCYHFEPSLNSFS